MSFINTTKYADDATLVALYSNTWRTEHSITHETENQMKGSVSFNRIHPGNEHNGIKNFYLEVYAEFTITKASTATVRIQNINDCIYDCNVSYNGNSGYVNQPYLNSIIKRCFDEDAFIEQASLRHDKYVNAVIGGTNTSMTVKYHCMTPLYHEFFDTKEITGLNDLSIRFNYNLFNLFKASLINPTDADAAGTAISAVAITNNTLKWKIIYDEVAHDIPAEQYTMQIPHFAYYEAQNDFTVVSSATSTNDFTINVRDVMTCPLRCYLIAAPRIREEEVALCNVISSRFIGSRWDIDGKKLNAFQSDGNDQLMSNFVNSRNAGLKSEFMTWAGRCDSITSAGVPIDPIVGITTLGTTNTYVSTAENWRLQVKGTIEHDQLNHCTTNRTLQGIVVYEYPAVLSLSSVASSTTGIIYSLNGTHDQLIEIEMDDNDYLKSLEEAGLLVGGSKIGDFFKNAWKKIKSSKFISKALNWIGNDSKKYNSLLSMIPVVGQFVPQIQDIASKAAPMVESAGLGVNLF